MIAYVNSVPFHYVDKGDPSAMPVVFLHGFPFSLDMWAEQVEAVSGQYRAIAYDIRGLGKSFVGEAQFTIEHHVDDLIAFLDYLKIDKAVIAALSMGGYIALRALERNPERFLAAALCDTKSEADTNDGKLKRFESMKGVRNHGSEVFAEAFVKNVFAADTFKTKPDEVARIKATIASTPALSIAGTLLALASRTDTTSSLPFIKVPVLILVGEKDATTPPTNSQAMHQKIAASEMHIIPNAAHMSNIENPEVFNRHLLAFLKRVAAQ